MLISCVSNLADQFAEISKHGVGIVSQHDQLLVASHGNGVAEITF